MDLYCHQTSGKKSLLNHLNFFNDISWPRFQFPVTFAWCSSSYSSMLPCAQYHVAHTSFSRITSVTVRFCFGLEQLAVNLGPRLLSEYSKNVQVITRFTAEAHTWTRSGEILILILDISRASFLSYQVPGPDVGFGQNGSQMWAWLNAEHSHEWKKGRRRISGYESLPFLSFQAELNNWMLLLCLSVCVCEWNPVYLNLFWTAQWV